MKYIFIVIFLFLPTVVFADTYEGATGFAQSFGDYLNDFWSFFNDDVPSFFDRMFIFFFEKLTLFWITTKLEMIKLSWLIAKGVIENFQIGSKLLAATSLLPNDVQAAFIDLRLFDAVNLLIQAYVTRFVLRIF